MGDILNNSKDMDGRRPVILASGSPRRLSILREHGVEPVVRPSDSDESLPENADSMTIEEKVMYIAMGKARAVYREWLEEQEGSPDESRPIILAADTIVYKGHIIGKPKDEDDAVAILSALRDTFHHVYSGVAAIDTEDGSETGFCDVTEVWFKDYDYQEIIRFIREEQPYDKSGSYAIQSSWSKNVDRVLGDIENVMGLPWYRVEPLLY